MKKITWLLIIATLVLSFTYNLMAQSIQRVDGKTLQFSAEDGFFSTGEKLFVTGANGKKKALIKVTSADGDLVKAVLLKGKVQVGDRVIDPSQSGASNTLNQSTRSSRKGNSMTFAGGARLAFSSYTVKGFSNGFVTIPDQTSSGTGFAGYGEIGYQIGEMTTLAGEFRFTSISWSNGGGSNTIMDFGILAKHRFSDFSLLGGFAPVTMVSGSGSSISGSTVTIGGIYHVNRTTEAVFEYRMVSANGNLNVMHFGANFLF